LKNLIDIVPESRIEKLKGSLDCNIHGIQIDSRAVKKNDLFVAIKGNHADGHQFIDQAIRNGASAVVCEKWPDYLTENICYVQVKNSQKVLGKLAANFYGHPASELNLIGITGTNGKTTTATLIYEMLEVLGYKCGLISTIENKIHLKVEKATHTTPNVIKINKLLRKMVIEGCTYVVMEVSSHAIDQYRIEGLDFNVAVFTNLTHEHLDYHGDFKNYIYTKKKFFDNLGSNAYALVNRDDRNGEVMIQNCKAAKKMYALQKMADYKAKVLDNSLEGLHLLLNGQEMYSRLVGSFNAYNLLAAYGVGDILNLGSLEILQALSSISSASGRFETIKESNTNITGIVDFAHTPDALENVIKTILDIRSNTSKLITVVGAGGDRDRAKRPIMAGIAARLSDQLILTSDNPRTEDPISILEEMEKGVPKELLYKMIIQSDRKQAIKTAVRLASEGDIILVAGKGHENYQEINGIKHPFDDRKILSACLRKDI
jgi:UDP-N-acetylmuramoyl-L-alanyl-D-glutamate--2,6-diaminopimelate ligase